jgi:hypothetical protein
MKAMEIGISSVNLPDSMLPHQYGSMRIVQKIASKALNLLKCLCDYLGVICPFREYAKTWGGQKNFDKTPSLIN